MVNTQVEVPNPLERARLLEEQHKWAMFLLGRLSNEVGGPDKMDPLDRRILEALLRGQVPDVKLDGSE